MRSACASLGRRAHGYCGGGAARCRERNRKASLRNGNASCLPTPRGAVCTKRAPQGYTLSFTCVCVRFTCGEKSIFPSVTLCVTLARAPPTLPAAASRLSRTGGRQCFSSRKLSASTWPGHAHPRLSMVVEGKGRRGSGARRGHCQRHCALACSRPHSQP